MTQVLTIIVLTFIISYLGIGKCIVTERYQKQRQYIRVLEEELNKQRSLIISQRRLIAQGYAQSDEGKASGL